MATDNFDSEIDDIGISPVEGILDDAGVFRLQTPNISSYNFDGFIGNQQLNIAASAVQPGMQISLTGSVGTQTYYTVLFVNDSDEELSASPSELVTIQYIDEDAFPQILSIGASAIISVQKENWDEKYLGENGWYIGTSGNAIFSNVAIRGEIEATTMDIGGAEGIIYDGNTVTIGASVVINAALTVGASGNFIVSGSAAQDIISNNTTITGGNIATGSIKSQGYSGPGTASAFSTSGMLINLDDGSITSNNFRINSSGSAFFKGEIVANSGLVNRLTVGGNDYPIENFIGQSGTNGGIILTTPAFATGPVKSLSINDLFVFKNSYYTGTATKDSVSQGPDFFDTVKFIVLTASIGSIESEKNQYYCRLAQTGLLSVYDFSGVSGSGFFNTGNLIFGTASAFSEASGYTVIDGFIFNNIGLGTMWSQYVPDFIDSNGDFKLGKGTIAFNGTALTISGSASLQSFGYSGVTDGSAFSSNGMNINLRLGSITAKQFRIDDLGNAFFQGSINATSGSFSGWLRSASITGGIISSGSFVGGILQSRGYNGVTNGSAFSSKGTHINLNDGTITSQQFRIDDLGNATFGGSLSSGISISAPLISGGTIYAPFVSGGTISAANIVGGTGNFTGDIQVVSRFTNYTGSAYLTKNAITSGGAEFPALDLRYDYLGTFLGRGTVGFGLMGSQPTFKLATDGSVPMQIYPGGDLYIATTFGNVYLQDDLIVTGNITYSGQPSTTILPGLIRSTSGPSGTYKDGTLWAVV